MAVRGLEPLNDFEIKVRDFMIPRLAKNIGQENAVSNFKIRQGLKERKGWEISEERIRAIIYDIRAKKLIRMLASGSNGYWVAKNEMELISCIRSLKGRIDAQQATVDQLEEDLFDKRSGKQMKMQIR